MGGGMTSPMRMVIGTERGMADPLWAIAWVPQRLTGKRGAGERGSVEFVEIQSAILLPCCATRH